jgi:hypothetical protein
MNEMKMRMGGGTDIAQLAEMIRRMGRGDDKILAHITPEEAAMLKEQGGSGEINPMTGLPEFQEEYDPNYRHWFWPRSIHSDYNAEDVQGMPQNNLSVLLVNNLCLWAEVLLRQHFQVFADSFQPVMPSYDMPDVAQE